MKSYINHTFRAYCLQFAQANGVKPSRANGGALDLSKAIRNMILNPDRHMAYYSRVIARMARKQEKSIPYMAVGVDKTGWTLYYNPEGIAKMTFDQLCYVMKHEILHVILNHHGRCKAGITDKVVITELDNVAMDLSVNSMLGDDMGLGGCLPGKPPFEGIPPGKSYEWYYKELHGKKNLSNLGAPGQAQGPDGPLTWEAHKRKMSADKVTQAQVNSVLGQALKETKAKGDMPGELETILNEVLKSRYNWKAELRNWAGEYYVTGQRLSRKRMNRRLPIFGIIPGSVNEYSAKLVVALDTSGSMPDRALKMLLGEVKAMGIPVIFVQCDSEIHEAKPISPYRKFDTKMKGRGGTDFRPVFEYAKKINANGVIYLTDLMGDFPDGDPIRTLWVCTEKDSKAPFGKTIYLPVEGD